MEPEAITIGPEATARVVEQCTIEEMKKLALSSRRHQWTPVSRELPPVGPNIGDGSHQILIWAPGRPVAPGHFSRFEDAVVALMSPMPGDEEATFATHWQELPEPPEDA